MDIRQNIHPLSVTLTKHSSGLLVLEQTVLGIRSDCTSVGSTIKYLLCGVVSHVSLTTELGGTTVQVGIVNRLTEGLALGPKVMFIDFPFKASVNFPKSRLALYLLRKSIPSNISQSIGTTCKLCLNSKPCVEKHIGCITRHFMLISRPAV